MLTGIHLLLTYTCNLQCDHCFLYCGPSAKGTMTLQQVTTVLDECAKIGTIQDIYFEGGEPFLFYPIMVEGIRIARRMGFKTGIVTNAYWASSIEDARLWLKPIVELGISDLSISDDDLHYGSTKESPAKFALAAAKELGISTYSLCKENPEITYANDSSQTKGTPEISGGIKFRGRAVEKFTEKLPNRSAKEFTTCPYEDFADPKRLHIDAYGYAHICQGISIGNCWESPLSELAKNYDPESHPICGPLVSGGPVGLLEKHGIQMKENYVDECHLCYSARKRLIEKFPELLGPRQLYGLETE